LKITHRRVGEYPKNSIWSTAVETHPGEALLQRQNIVADHEVAGVEQHDSIAQAPACLIKVPKGLRADNPINGNSPLLLKCAHRMGEGLVVPIRSSVTARGF
jgi:hypothetical protein